MVFVSGLARLKKIGFHSPSAILILFGLHNRHLQKFSLFLSVLLLKPLSVFQLCSEHLNLSKQLCVF